MVSWEMKNDKWQNSDLSGNNEKHSEFLENTTKPKPLTKIGQTWQSKLFLGKVASLCIMAIKTFVARWNLNPRLFKPKIHINNPVDSLKWLERMYNFVQHSYQLIKNIFKSF